MEYINDVTLQGMTPNHAQAITHRGQVIRIDFKLRIEVPTSQIEGVDNLHSTHYVRVQVLTMQGFATEKFVFRPSSPIRITGMYLNGAIEALTAEYLNKED